MRSFKMLMMQMFSILIFSATIAFSSCNNNSTSKQEQPMLDSSMSMTSNTMADNNVKMIEANFMSVDPGVSDYIKSLLQNYLAVKNALIDGNTDKAATASKSIYDAMKGFDKSLFTAQQKEAYDAVEDDLKVKAQQILKSKQEEQRQHFAAMSKDMYAIVKAFGAGMTLYQDHCPMYNDGSIWLSEIKDIRNPYYGKSMMTCGDVEEIFQ